MGTGSPTKLCEICEEAGVVRLARVVNPKRLCVTHYNQQRPDRHKKVSVPCDWCGKPCEKATTGRYESRFCTYPCRDAWRVKHGHVLSAEARAKGQAVKASRPYKAAAKLRKAARGTRGRGCWTAGLCERCGNPFVSVPRPALGRFCSDTCKHRANHSRRRGRERAAYSERYSRHQIFERDGWRCHICKRKTKRTAVVPHPQAPVLDHLMPLAEGGHDTAANVATAHFLCNSIKRECGGGEQLALIG